MLYKLLSGDNDSILYPNWWLTFLRARLVHCNDYYLERNKYYKEYIKLECNKYYYSLVW